MRHIPHAVLPGRFLLMFLLGSLLALSDWQPGRAAEIPAGQALEARIAELRRATAMDPTDDQRFIDLGRLLAETRRYAEAKNAFLDALRCGKDSPQAHFLLGSTLLQLPDEPQGVENAVREYRLLLSLDKALAGKLAALLPPGALDSREVKQAKKTLAGSVNEEGLILLARALFKEGRVADAVNTLEEAVAEFPEAAAPHLELARIHLRQNRRDQAMPEFQEAAWKAIEERSAYLAERGITIPPMASAAANASGPKTLLDRLASNSVQAYSYRLLGQELRGGATPAEARDIVLEENTFLARSWCDELALGQALGMSSASVDVGETILRNVLQRDPSGSRLPVRGDGGGPHGLASLTFEAALSLGQLCLVRGRPEAASEPLQEAVQRDPRSGKAWEALGESLGEVGRGDEAIKAFGCGSFGTRGK